MKSGEIHYGADGGSGVVQFVGDIRYTMCCAFDKLLDVQLSRSDLQRFFIDLRQATAVDSTTLGLMAKIANTLAENGHPKPIVLSVNPDINELLDSLGFDEIFEIRPDAPDCPTPTRQLAVADPAKQQMSRVVLNAHLSLSDLNDNNREQFRGVVEALSEKAPSV
jgi:anti-anti-sigma regulatory factor